MSESSYYNDSKFYYPELAICIEKIDRMTPKEYKFIIPILLPTLPPDKETSKDIKLSTSSNIINEEPVTIEDIVLSNAIGIYMPMEVMSYTLSAVGMSGTISSKSNSYNLKGIQMTNVDLSAQTQTMRSTSLQTVNTSVTTNVTVSLQTGQGSGTGTGTGSLSGGGSTVITAFHNSGSAATLKAPGDAVLDLDTNTDTALTIAPYDRYIPEGSKWVVSFLSGDPTKPFILSRYR